MSKSITHPIFSAALALGLVTLGLGIAGDASAQTVTLRYGQAFSALRSIFALPLLVAEREKFFAREGLNFVVVPITGGGEKLIEALHDDTADMTYISVPLTDPSMRSTRSPVSTSLWNVSMIGSPAPTVAS